MDTQWSWPAEKQPKLVMIPLLFSSHYCLKALLQEDLYRLCQNRTPYISKDQRLAENEVHKWNYKL
jgi:hypothetical protein